ncbi:glycosyltransferase family 2 protein [Lutimonas halocynthiae]|uniref:glycosyltransferase n=1 Tax=Lutimonas halocynthiae TaxID=1446477 RepID=UPI0025B53F45|nr:glycosyltransferase family 2 protein [Lutimonas halocynthiae]MDN3642969.1 glycosyltransferase family 2 protein [Lutimonas halocynthiae]
MNQIIDSLLQILEYTLLAYFGFASIYIFIFSFAGLWYRPRTQKIRGKIRKIAILIPGYKEDQVIIEVTKSALLQRYPMNLFDVVVIADSFQRETMDQLRALPIKLVEVQFDQSTKSKALNKGIEAIGDHYDVAIVLDADNIMEPNFISKINKAFNNGYMVVQGHRAAKNENTSFAILDAISEEVNNHIFRKGHRALGLSSGLIGSGMAFEYHFFKNTMAKVNAVGGFDKELELRLLKSGETIEYLNDAMVLDEKIQKSQDFQNQRRRWISTQFVYFKKYFLSGVKELVLRGNIDFFDKVYQMVSPPRILLLGIVLFITLIYGAIDLFAESIVPHLDPSFWYITLMITVLAFLMAIPFKFYNSKTLIAMLTLPKAFSIMFLLLFKLKGANKKFIHTSHGTVNS